MLAVHISEGVGLRTPEPFVREVRVLLSPLLQPELADLGVNVGYTEVAPGQAGSRHTHIEEAEIWLFFAGRGLATLGDETREIGPGTVVYTPPGVEHEFVNNGDEPVKLFWFYAPSGAERQVIEGAFR